MASRPLDIQYFAPRAGERIKFPESPYTGEAYAYGEKDGQQTSAATNIPSAIERASMAGIGGPMAPRPPSDLTQMLGRIPRPDSAYNESALSPQQQSFLAERQAPQGQGLSSAPLRTPAQQEQDREVAMMARFDEAKAYGLRRATEPGIRQEQERGTQQRLTEDVKQSGRKDLESQKAQNRLVRDEAGFSNQERRDTYASDQKIIFAQIQDAMADQNLVEADKLKKEASASQHQNALELLYKSGEEVGSDRWNQVQEALFQAQIGQQLVKDRAAFDRNLQTAQAGIIKSAGSILASDADQADKDQAVAFLLKATRSMGASKDQPVIPTSVTAKSQGEKVSTDLDGDGKPDITQQAADQINFWNGVIVSGRDRNGSELTADRVKAIKERINTLKIVKPI